MWPFWGTSASIMVVAAHMPDAEIRQSSAPSSILAKQNACHTNVTQWTAHVTQLSLNRQHALHKCHSTGKHALQKCHSIGSTRYRNVTLKSLRGQGGSQESNVTQ
jgi:hypothetical protein